MYERIKSRAGKEYDNRYYWRCAKYNDKSCIQEVTVSFSLCSPSRVKRTLALVTDLRLSLER